MFKFTKILTVVAMIAAMAVPALADFNGTKTVVNAETWDVSGNYADTANTVITVDVGGTHTGGECQIANASWGGYTFEHNINGTADIEQYKLDGACTVVVSGALIVDEGYMGKSANASITINAGASMTIDASANAWAGEFEIRTEFTSYIDLVGTGTIRLINDGTYAANLWNDHLVVGNGGSTPVTTAQVGDYLVYSTTSGSTPVPGTLVYGK